MRLQSVEDSCEVDAGGLPVVWLNGITPAASTTWLQSLIRTSDAAASAGRTVADRAIALLVWHDTAEASRTLIELARQDPRPTVRARALSSLAQRAGDEVVTTLATAVDSDPELSVKKRAVAALGRMPNGEGVPRLIEIARTHASREVRRQAMNSLGQSKDPRALSFFEDVLRR